MLEHVPAAVGRSLAGVRAGPETLTSAKHFADVPATLAIGSAAFAHEGPLPPEFTADGAGLSPPIEWRGLPEGTEAVVIIIEDADSPTPDPLVHAIVLDLPGRDGGVAAGALEHGSSLRLGKNSFLKAEYLPPDPPAGHGPHRYAIQVFALDRSLGLAENPGRGAVVEAMRGHVLAKGALFGTYQRF